MEPERFVIKLKRVATLTRFSQLSADFIDAYYRKFSWMTEEQWIDVCDAVMDRQKYFPKIAELCKIVEEKKLLHPLKSDSSAFVVVDCACGQSFSISRQELETAPKDGEYFCPGISYGRCNRRYSAGFIQANEKDGVVWAGQLRNVERCLAKSAARRTDCRLRNEGVVE